MTDDAVPADENLVAELLKPLLEKKAEFSYARQLPNEDCGVIETFTRGFNYPEESCIKSKEDLERLQIKTYFFSNVCAAYTRNIYDELGGFDDCAIFNEDMIYAAKAIKNKGLNHIKIVHFVLNNIFQTFLSQWCKRTKIIFW